MGKFFIAFAISLYTLSSLFAQKTIEGTIRDNEGYPVIGVFVSYNGSSEIILSDEKGEFKIVTPNSISHLNFEYFTCPEPVVAQIPSNGKMNIKLNCVVELEGLVVTGSVERSSVSASIFPIDRLNIKNVSLQGWFIDVNNAMNILLPSVQSNRQTIADGTDHIDPVAIRGLGPDQALVLVNGKRYHKSALVNVNGTTNRGTVGVDLSSIPLGAIERIELLRDGAAAQYGSDAISGVVNIILKAKEQGLQFQINSGLNLSTFPYNYYINRTQPTSKVYGYKDNKTIYDGKFVRISSSYGFVFNKKNENFKDQSFIQISTELGIREGTNRAGTFTGPIYSDSLLHDRNVDDSVLIARNLTRSDFHMRIGASSIENHGLVLNGEYVLGNKSKLYITSIQNIKFGESSGFYRFPAGYPASIYTEMSRIYPNGFLPLIQTKILDYSIIGGFRQKLSDQFEVDASFTLGRNNFDFYVANSINYTQAKSTPPVQTEFDCGGLVFEHKAYNFTLHKSAGLGLSRSNKTRLIFFLGGEYRQEMFAIRPGEQSSYFNYRNPDNVTVGAQVFQGFTPPEPSRKEGVTRNNFATFFDLALSNLIPRLKLESAYRFEHYSDFGANNIYKLAARYDIFGDDKLGIRGSYNTGFRAPSLHQIGYTKVSSIFVSTANGLQAVDVGTYRNNSPEAQALGIPQLQPETSHNYSVGLASQISRVLRFTVDGYRINIKKRIILTNNFSAISNPKLQELLQPLGVTFANFFTNAVDTRATGVEGALFYEKRWPINNKKLNIELSVSAFRNTVLDSIDVLGSGSNKPFIYASQKLIELGEVGNYFNREDESRLEVALPNTKAVGSISYETGNIALNLRSTYFGQVQYIDPQTTTPINIFTGQPESLDQTFSPKIVTDVSVQFKLRKFQLGLGCNNIFDVYPDVHKHSANFSDGRFIYSRRVHQMGLNGRSIFVNLVYFSKKQ